MPDHSRSGSARGGIRATAEMLRELDRDTRERILQNVAAKDPRLAQDIRDRMFLFEDLAGLPDRELQLVLREVPHALLATSLRKTTEEMKAAVLRNLSERSRPLLEEELQAHGVKRLAEVEAAQREIVSVARRLEAEGRLSLDRCERV